MPFVDAGALEIEFLGFGKGEAGEGDVFWRLDDLVSERFDFRFAVLDGDRRR